MRFARFLPLVLAAACGAKLEPTSPMEIAAPPRPMAVNPPAPAATVATAPAVATAATDVPPAADPKGDTHVSAGINPWVETSRDRLSTFAADVDTASYTYSRRVLQGGQLPDPAAVRVEEFVNAFRYRFPAPAAGSPFAVIMDAAPSPLDPRHDIVRVAVATPPRGNQERKPANLVFLVDVSGSMDSPDKLPLAREALRTLTRQLRPDDTVALVTYAGDTRVVLSATSGKHQRAILDAIDQLGAGGSTAMASGLDLAYREAMRGVRPGVSSRVIVLTDGDANVGPTSASEILATIEHQVKAGVTLSTIGFGMGNYRDDLMEQLGDHGNGNNYYVDSEAAATKLFTTDLVSVLEVAAKDVKLQVEFDPARVSRYRLLGYEDRDVADRDFRNDAVDAGEVGVGHQVTALYEVELTDRATPTTGLGVVRIRHKAPDGDTASEATFAMGTGAATSFDVAPEDFRFAVAVAAFADLLRGSEDARRWSLARIEAVARAAARGQPDRLELVELIAAARKLHGDAAVVAN